MILLLLGSVLAGYIVNRWWIVPALGLVLSVDVLVTQGLGLEMLASLALSSGLAYLGLYFRRRPSRLRRWTSSFSLRRRPRKR